MQRGRRPRRRRVTLFTSCVAIVLHRARSHKAVASSVTEIPHEMSRSERVDVVPLRVTRVRLGRVREFASRMPGSEEERDDWRAFAARRWYGRGSFSLVRRRR